MISRSSRLLVLLFLSGCSMFIPEEPPPAPPPELPPVVESEAPPEPVAEPQPEPEPVVRPDPRPEPQSRVEKPLVAIVLSDRTPAYVDVALALEPMLDRFEVYDLSDRSLQPKDAFATIAATGADAVVAVGMPAARAARRFATVPVVVGQVFNVHDGDLLTDDVKAVSVLPPIEMQIDAWQQIDPSIRNVGAIVGPGHEELVAAAERVMKERGIKFHFAIAQSDRETLYLFNRLVRDIDGFILFPDNRVLSRTVLGEMMSYASRHRVQVAVFNEPLLAYGAMISTGAVEYDIAARIGDVLEKVFDGHAADVPPVTPLTEIDVQINPEVIQRLGLEAPQHVSDDRMADAT